MLLVPSDFLFVISYSKISAITLAAHYVGTVFYYWLKWPKLWKKHLPFQQLNYKYNSNCQPVGNKYFTVAIGLRLPKFTCWLRSLVESLDAATNFSTRLLCWLFAFSWHIFVFMHFNILLSITLRCFWWLPGHIAHSTNIHQGET